MGVRKNRQYGIGEVSNIKDLSAFGWVVVVREEDDGRPGKKEVIVKRPANIGEDALIKRMEATYEAECKDLENAISMEYLIKHLITFIVGIPALLFSLLYLLSGYFENILPITSAIDFGAKKAFSFIGETGSGIAALSVRFVFFAVAVLCVVFFFVNIFSYFNKQRFPRKYYPRSAKAIEETLLIARQRVECIKFSNDLGSSAESESSIRSDMSFNEIKSSFCSEFNGQFVGQAHYSRKKLMPYFESYKMPAEITYDDPSRNGEEERNSSVIR